MKVRRIQRKLVNPRKMEGEKGKSAVVVYYQEGKKLVYYSGKRLKKNYLYRKSDRSFQKWWVLGPSVLWAK